MPSYELKTFWMIWRHAGPPPSCSHETREAAVQEAHRLARKHPGEIFYILRATDYATVESAPVTMRPL